MTHINLLFTCPHDGRKNGAATNPPIIKRTTKNFPANSCRAIDGQGFSDENDVLAKELTNKVFKNIQILSGKLPYKQLANFKRKFIDYNRKDTCAFVQSSSALTAYNEYHNGILQKIEEMLSKDDTSLAFLFDIHGTGRRKMRGSDGKFHEIEVIIGTQQGDTIGALNQKDPAAWWGDDGLIPLLQKKNIKVWPPNLTQEEDSTKLDGGYTIQEYSKIKGVVAIQIEVFHCLRENVYCCPCRDIFAADLADCIYNFVQPFVRTD